MAGKEQEKKILDFIKIGVKEGANLLCGGNKIAEEPYGKGFFISPTIFEASHGMRVTKEEIFGPVLSLIQVKDFEEAIAVANDVEYGLSSSFTPGMSRWPFRPCRL